MSNNVIHIDWIASPKLDIPLEAVRNFIFSFGYDPDNTEELNEFIYKAYDLIVTED